MEETHAASIGTPELVDAKMRKLAFQDERGSLNKADRKRGRR
jgi:hypothetical protein